MNPIIRMVNAVFLLAFVCTVISWLMLIIAIFGEPLAMLFGLIKPIGFDSYEGPSMPAWRSDLLFLSGMSGLLTLTLSMLSDLIRHFSR